MSSYWIETCKNLKFNNQINSNYEADVCIIGAGICGLPFKICGAIKLKNQAQFNPSKYMFGLTNSIQNYGSRIFTNSLVIDVKKCIDYYTTYVNQYSVKSKYLVIASHFPFINFPGIYFSKMYQSTSYVIAVDTKEPSL